jgi:sugar-specific transcriptional regulator TrmB
VQEIGAATGVKRPTIYHALHTLSEKGLVAERDRDGKSAFRMEAPGRLLGWIEQQKNALTEKEDAVQSLISQLATRTPAVSGGIEVMQYADAKSVQAVFDLAFYARSKKCVVIIASKDFLNGLGLDEKSRDAEHRGVLVQTVVRKGVGAALLTYDDSVVMITNPSEATVITSSALASILSNLF